MEPERFGHYLLFQPLGCGGMAEVYLAKSISVSGFEKLLAIKRLLPSCGEDQHVIDLLADEARITVQLDHPNIVQVFDFGVLDGSYYIAMEYVDGTDLKALLEGPDRAPASLPLDISLHLAISILDGLSFAHTCSGQDGQPLRIIHRDVTPHNVLISRHGIVKLTDFGVARARISNHVSQVGDVRGKFSYMPPEQVCGGELDHRVDIFAVGAILYELISGKQPFRSANFSEQMKLLTRELMPPSKLVAEIPAALDAITLRALHVDPAQRFASANDFADALRELQSQLQISQGAVMKQLANLVLRHRNNHARSDQQRSEVMKRSDFDRTSGTSLIGQSDATATLMTGHDSWEREATVSSLSSPLSGPASITAVTKPNGPPRAHDTVPGRARAPAPRPSALDEVGTKRAPRPNTRTISGEIAAMSLETPPATKLHGTRSTSAMDRALLSSFTPTDPSTEHAPGDPRPHLTDQLLEGVTDPGSNPRAAIALARWSDDTIVSNPPRFSQRPAHDDAPKRQSAHAEPATLHLAPTLIKACEDEPPRHKHMWALWLLLVLAASGVGAIAALMLIRYW